MATVLGYRMTLEWSILRKWGCCVKEGGVVWSKAVDQAELTWSAQGGVLELTGGSSHTDDPLLEVLK